MNSSLWPDFERLRRYDRLIWVAMWALVMTAGAVTAGYYFYGAVVSNAIADYAFAHAGGAADNEKAATADVPMISAIEIGALGGRGEGISCSLPAISAWAFRDNPPYRLPTGLASKRSSASLQFRQACLKHDLCYRHGAATYGYTQMQCDTFLAEDAFRICRYIYKNPNNIEWCRTQARKVLSGVTLGGAAGFRGVGAPNWRFQVREARRRNDQFSISTYLEYDPYPSGAARYYAPRLIPGGCGAGGDMLATYWHRRGGSLLTQRCLKQQADGQWTLEKTGIKSRPKSEVDFLPRPPVIISNSGKPGWMMRNWCRIEDSNKPTEGAVAQYQPAMKPDWFAGCNFDTSKDDILADPDTPNIFAVPQPNQAHYDYVTFTSNGPKGTVKCNANFWTGAELRWATKSGESGTPEVITLPAPAGPTPDCYRWTVTAPQFVVRENHAVDVLFFRRGDSDGKAYSQELQVARITIGADGSITRPDKLITLQLPEEQEPFVAVPQGSNGIALLSVTRDQPASTASFFWRISVGSVAAFLIVLVFWSVLGRGYAVLAALASLLVISFQFMTRDDVARGNLLPGSIALRFHAIAEGGKTQTFIWREERAKRLSPAHFIQNRMSIIKMGDKSLRLVGIHFTPLATPCSLKPTLAVLQLRPPSGEAQDWQVVQGQMTMPDLDVKVESQPGETKDNSPADKAKECRRAATEATSRISAIPFLDSEGRPHILAVETALADHHAVSADIDMSWTESQILLRSD